MAWQACKLGSWLRRWVGIGAVGAGLAVTMGLALRDGAGLAPATAATAGKELECRWTETPPQIDGKGTDDVWRTATVIDSFGQPWLGSEARPRTATRARLLWDRENLYFLAEMEDHDLLARVTEPDGATWNDDVIELFLKPSEEHPGYYEFQVTPSGNRLDMFLPERSKEGWERHRKNGEFHWETRVTVRGTVNRKDRDRGWTVEGRIPWTDLLRTGGRPEVGEVWKLAFCRYDYNDEGRDPSLSTTAPLTKPDFHRYEDYSRVRFAGPQAKRGQALAGWSPVTTSRVVGSPDPPLPYRARRVYPKLKLTYPVTVVREPGSDRMLAVVQTYPGGPSKVIRFRDDPDVEQWEELLSVDWLGYDLTFHPDFARNGYVYFSSRGPFSAPDEERKVTVVRYVMDRRPPYALRQETATTIIEWLSNGHDGAALAFGKDGMLYVTTGDGTSDSDLPMAGQNMSLLLSKLLRIDVDHPDPGRAYSVPKDNPFVNMPGVRPETWAYGFRNPWRMTVDQETGHIWVGNNGQDLWEQAYLIEKGANYGWSVYEGSHPFYPDRKLGPTPHVKPTVEHPHSEARSLTGGVVYYGRRFPELRGAYIYGDYSTGKIWAAKARGVGLPLEWHREIADTPLQIAGFGVDSQGELLIADMRGGGEGGFYTLEPSPKVTTPSTFPRRLSESGLFASVKKHGTAPGLIPYDVNAPLWSDGAYKERYLALPGPNPKIDVTPSRGWHFPEGTVLVKSFALETVEGDPKSRRWIETRFLTKQDGEWVGYSYLWNEEQTDATLVEAKGLDREFEIRVPKSAQHPDGIRRQKWRYPSRAECMTCHSRAANFVLGLTTEQMNRVHDYGKTRENQLTVLERLGVLRVDYPSEARAALRAAFRARGQDENAANALANRQLPLGGQRPPRSTSLLGKSPDAYPRLVNPYDRKQDLTARAKSYLQGNCAGCHVEAGGGNAQMELEYATALERMRILDVKPQHAVFGIADARLVAPGSPERSVLLHRISHREQGHMPPLATSRVDEKAVALMREWIRSLGK